MRLGSLELRAELPDEEPLSALAPVLRTQLAHQGHNSFICVTFEDELSALIILKLKSAENEETVGLGQFKKLFLRRLCILVLPHQSSHGVFGTGTERGIDVGL